VNFGVAPDWQLYFSPAGDLTNNLSHGHTCF